MRVAIKHKGSFKNVEKFLKGYDSQKMSVLLERLGQIGTNALADATPIDSGATADLWWHMTTTTKYKSTIQWMNSSVDNGAPVVILLQYGHGTKSGGFVQGNDFINPAMRPVFNLIAEALWEEVTKL